MRWYFEPRPSGNEAEWDRGDVAPIRLSVPAALLMRHGARVLDPGRAPAVDGYDRPRPTVYRARTVLVPDDQLQDADIIRDYNTVLGRVGMQLAPPREGRDTGLDPGRVGQRVSEALRQLPRPVALVPLPGYPFPVDVDAWTALQTLRAATVPPSPPADGERDEPERDAPRRVLLDKAAVDQIELEHLLAGSAITGSPIGGGHGGITGDQDSSSGASGPTDTDSYLFSGGDARTPVTVMLEPPPRGAPWEYTSRCGRRPVIAVLDSGVRANRWLGVKPDGSGGYIMTPAGDRFIATDDAIQTAIEVESEQAAAHDRSRRVLTNAWDDPMADNPLIDELNDALGHSTFIAGVVRQVAPGARVLAVRVTSSDDILYEGDIICGLSHLAQRIALAQPGDLVAEVDVVSLSFGYFSETRHDKKVTSGLWQAIELLLSLGVVVIAAAGNYASGQPFFPAGFALKPVPADQVPVISVGAFNPNGTKAMFSNDGRWVTAWALGASVVSTYPTDIDGSRTPDLRIPANRKPAGQWPQGREALDADDYSSGFAVWSGTSFSAPYVAALMANSLAEGAAGGQAGMRLTDPGIPDRKKRAVAAYDRLRQQGHDLG